MVSIMRFSFRFVGSVCVLTDPREGHRCPKLLLSLPHSLRQELGWQPESPMILLSLLCTALAFS